MIQITGYLLEVTQGEFNGNPWVAVKLRNDEIAGSAILKYKVDAKRVSFDRLAALRDTECTFNVDITRGQNDNASLRIVDLA